MDLNESLSQFQKNALESSLERGWKLIKGKAYPFDGGKPMPKIAYKRDDGSIIVEHIRGNGKRVNSKNYAPGDDRYDRINSQLPS